MASVAAINSLRTSRQPLQRLAASLLPATSLFASPSSRLTNSPVSSSTASLEPSTSSVSFSLPLAGPSSAPATVFASLTSLIPDSLAAGLRDLLPPWVLAVPKRRTTHSAKRMRSANKHLKEKQNLVACPGCGAPKLSHHLCHSCHVAFRREYHREAKEQGIAQKP
ncbi:mitochondrial 54S ribosomal protein bL32m MRPL32 [Sporobolomyces salmoneus]|uniref:mitochondrial 54S ribosomal protein bL32m MRPL32 n=1 Tax=Sporobolomyces salmoneus TaxID=183962 RepID=UPI00317A5AD0